MEAGAGFFLAAGLDVSGSPNGLGIPPAKTGGTAIVAVKLSVKSELKRERMGPAGSLFTNFDAGHDCDFFLLLRLILCRQDPHPRRKQPGQRSNNEQETEKARHFCYSVPM
jgi:hypothetical protein